MRRDAETTVVALSSGVTIFCFFLLFCGDEKGDEVTEESQDFVGRALTQYYERFLTSGKKAFAAESDSLFLLGLGSFDLTLNFSL